jgi:hypothetical protein
LKRAEQVLPGRERRWGGEREGARGMGEKWPKQCMHMYINKFKKFKNKTYL